MQPKANGQNFQNEVALYLANTYGFALISGTEFQRLSPMAQDTGNWLITEYRYGTKNRQRLDLFVWQEKLGIECKIQTVPGTVCEKIPHAANNLIPQPFNSIVLYSGSYIHAFIAKNGWQTPATLRGLGARYDKVRIMSWDNGEFKTFADTTF